MKRFVVMVLAVLVAMTMGSLAACKSAGESVTEQEWSITVQGPGGDEIEFTDQDAAKMDMVEITAVREKKDGSKTEEDWTGVLLKDVLESAGVSDYGTVTVEASDGYSKDLDTAVVEDAGTILGFIKDGEEITADDGLVQLVVSSMPGNYWVKNVAVIRAAE